MQDVFEISLLIRSWSNSLTPVNRIPSEILALLPDSWDTDYKDQGTIVLTHVCRAWREIFTSRSSLWADFNCMDVNKTHVYLERSKSSPINVSLNRVNGLSPCDPFLLILPQAIGRLKSLFVDVELGYLQDITPHLSLPAPLLEDLSIDGGSEYLPRRNPTLTSTLFGGDLSPLRVLYLQSVRTELPWRNMVNLTSFTLAYTSPGEVSVGHLLDFFECAPRLREVRLRSATPTFGAQNGRLVSLACLKRMDILESGPCSLLLDHLLIPVGAELTTQVDLPTPLIEDYLPRSLDNLRNLSDFTEIHLYATGWYPRVRLSGPNGKVTMVLVARTDVTCTVLESLTRFDISKAERLEIDQADPSSRDLPYRTFKSMKGLRILTLFHCRNPHIFIDALHPSMNSGVVVCPELEGLVLVLHVDEGMLDMKGVIGMAAARAVGGVKLKSIRIVGYDKVVRADVLELEKHVLHVECGTDIGGASDEEY